MSCDFLTVQVGQQFLSWSNLSVRKGTGSNGKSASFNFFLETGQLRPAKGSLVSIVLNGKKIFGGIAANIKRVRVSPREYSCTCVDFTLFTRKNTIAVYDSISEQPIEIHAARLIEAGTISDADQTGITRQLLNFVPPATDPNEEPKRFRFIVKNEKLDAVLSRLCATAGYRWTVDNGTWLDTTNIGSHIANVILAPNNSTQQYASVSINLQDPCGKWENLTVDFQARDITRVIVAKDAESLSLGKGITPRTTIHAQSIAAASEQRFFRLLKRTGIIKKAVINTNDEGGDGGDGDGGDGGGFF
jgi:hypothetical protein